MDITDDSSIVGRTITIESRAPPITIKSITFDPKNISEESSYTFKFITSDILSNTMDILFLFPIDYDPLLGR